MLAGASNIQENEGIRNTEEINEISTINFERQSTNLIFYLKNGYAPSNLSYKNKHAITLKEKNFMIVDDVLFKQNYDSILLRCLEKPEAQKVLHKLHHGLVGGHFGSNTTTHKTIHAEY